MTSVGHKDIHEMSCEQDGSGAWTVMYRATVRVEKEGVYKEATGYSSQSHEEANAARGLALDGALDMALRRALALLGEQPPARTSPAPLRKTGPTPSVGQASGASVAAAMEAQKKKEAEQKAKRDQDEAAAEKRRREEEQADAEEKQRALAAAAEAEAARQRAAQEEQKRARADQERQAREAAEAAQRQAEEEAAAQRQAEEEEERRKADEEAAAAAAAAATAAASAAAAAAAEEKKRHEEEEKAKAAAAAVAAVVEAKSPRPVPVLARQGSQARVSGGPAASVAVKGRASPQVTPAAAGAGPRKQLSLSSRKNVKQFQPSWNEHAARLQEALGLPGAVQSKVDWVPLADKCDEGGHKFACGEIFYDKIMGGLAGNLTQLAGTAGREALLAQWTSLSITMRFDEKQAAQWSAGFVEGGDLELVSHGEPWLDVATVGADLLERLLPKGAGGAKQPAEEELDAELGLPLSAAASLRNSHDLIEAAERRVRDAAGLDFDIVVDIDYHQLLDALGPAGRARLGETWLVVLERLAASMEDVVAK